MVCRGEVQWNSPTDDLFLDPLLVPSALSPAPRSVLTPAAQAAPTSWCLDHMGLGEKVMEGPVSPTPGSCRPAQGLHSPEEQWLLHSPACRWLTLLSLVVTRTLSSSLGWKISFSAEKGMTCFRKELPSSVLRNRFCFPSLSDELTRMICNANPGREGHSDSPARSPHPRSPRQLTLFRASVSLPVKLAGVQPCTWAREPAGKV